MKLHLKSTRFTLLFSAVILCSILAAFILPRHSASALSSFDYNYGNIIDDGVFYNKSTMNVQQIQDFLNRLISNCDTWGTSPSEYGGGTRAQYAASRGWHGPPYACLNNYHENPSTGETSFEKGGGAFAGGISAAQIIYDAAQTYGINPQVLLVLLKKESAGPLTADTWPLKSQYRYAMGYACPDSGPGYSANCSAEKAGFYKQMMLAAWQLKYYRDHPNDYRYGVGWNDIQYSPNPDCGTRRVLIENLATLSLYIYTPYVPNHGALANYPGTAHCGAYGNRNFFMFFSEWFGSTRGNAQIDMLKADREITETYDSYKVQLGNPVTQRIAEFNATPRVWQNFENGTVIWTNTYGAQPVFQQNILNRWRTIGGSAGSLGVPKSTSITESDDGRIWQDFSGGTVIYSQQTGAWEILHGPLGDKWRSVGGSRGLLGRPTSGVVIDSHMRIQAFEKGAVVRKDTSSPAYTLVGDIYALWNVNRATLKVPKMDAIQEQSDNRIWQYFQGNNLVISSDKGTWVIHSGLFHDAWKDLGGSTGELGVPAGKQYTEADGRVWQTFEKGLLIQKTASSPVHGVKNGPVFTRWKDLGGSTGELGVPAGKQYTEADGRVWQYFEDGLVIHSNTGTWEIQGWFHTIWRQQYGGSLGKLGKPTSGKVIESDGTRWQTFEKGKLIWSSSNGWSTQWN